MKELKLTDEQLEQAFNAAWEAGEYTTEEVTEERIRENFRTVIRAAAPYLQAPWEPPTVEEEDISYNLWQTPSVSCKMLLADFINRRNAALLPKPVDPSQWLCRLEKIVNILRESFGYSVEAYKCADAILAALEDSNG